MGARDKASIFLIKCTRPEHADDVMENIRHTLPNYTVRPLKEFLSLMTSTNIPGLQSFINAMIALAIAIGLLVIFLTMYTTVIERTRDIGVLKSLGADRSFIICALLTESAALCLFGILAGVGLELRRPRRISRGLPNFVHSHYSGMDSPRGRNCVDWVRCSAPAIRRGSPAAKTPWKRFPTTRTKRVSSRARGCYQVRRKSKKGSRNARDG